MAVPRLLPVVAVAIGGVLAVQALAGAPKLLSATRALAEDVAGAKPASQSPLPPNASVATAPVAAKPAPQACAPTAAELAKEAGLSPAELQVLQSLGDRRGQLDQREQDLDTQVQLIAAAEAKLDSRIKEMNGLKGDITTLLSQADAQQDTETERLIRVYEAMKPKDAAARFTLMSDGVRVPMAAKMKERALAAILAQMPADDAKALTERLAGRVKDAQSVASARNALNPPASPAASTPNPDAQAAADTADTTDAPAKPAPHRMARAKPHARAKAAAKSELAAAAAPSAAAPAAAMAAKPSTTTSTGAPSAKSG